MIDDKALKEAGLAYAKANPFLTRADHDEAMRDALVEADKVRAEGFDLGDQSRLASDRRSNEVEPYLRNAFAAGLAKSEAEIAALVEALTRTRRYLVNQRNDPGMEVFAIIDCALALVRKGVRGVTEFKQYRRKAIAEIAAWEPGFDMTDVSVSPVDKAAGSPKMGDMIGRNPVNYDDKWLIAANYFAANFEPMP